MRLWRYFKNKFIWVNNKDPVHWEITRLELRPSPPDFNRAEAYANHADQVNAVENYTLALTKKRPKLTSLKRAHAERIVNALRFPQGPHDREEERMQGEAVRGPACTNVAK